MEHQKRSIVKTISWRLTGTGATFLIAFVMTGNFELASVIGSLQLVTNSVLYYLHERIWNKITWGKDT